MRHRKTVLPLICLVAAFLPCGTASAQTRGWYAGGGVASSNVGVAESDYWYGDFEDGDEDSGFIVTVGYRVNRFLAVEAGYLDGGNPEWDDYLMFLPELRDVYDTDVLLDVTAYQASALGILPFGRRWEVYLKGGVSYSDIDSDQILVPSFGGTTITRTVDDSGADFLFGLGFGVSLGRHLHVRTEFQSFYIDDELLAINDDYDGSIDSFTLELHFRFGDGWNRGR